MKRPRVLALNGDENGCTLWRVFQPYTRLQEQGYGAWFRHKDDPQTYTEDFPYLAATRLDAIVLPRLSWQEHAVSRRWVNALHRVGLTVIYEVDDDIFTPQITARQHATTEPDKTFAQLEDDRRNRIEALRLCDGVTVSNERLGRIVRRYVDTPVRVVPNSIDRKWWRDTLRGVRRVVPPLTIGWAGGARYQEDLEPLAEAWHNIARRYPEVNFVIMGFPSEVLHDAVPADRVHVFKWRPVTEYPLDMTSIDIGCASVAGNHFNQCKTPIKVWEYTMAGAAVVVSPTLYGDVVSDGEDALVAETAAEWTAALSRLVEDAELRRRLKRNQRRRVATDHSLERNVMQWPAAWQSIIDVFRNEKAAA